MNKLELSAEGMNESDRLLLWGFIHQWEKGDNGYTNEQNYKNIESFVDSHTQLKVKEGTRAKDLIIKGLEEENEGLKKLLRFDGCPEILIENPVLLSGGKATKEDIRWAREVIKKYENDNLTK